MLDVISLSLVMPANMEPLRKDILFAFLSIISVSSILQINYNNK